MRYALVAFYDSKGLVVCSEDLGLAASVATERAQNGQGDNVIIAGFAFSKCATPEYRPVNHYRTKREERALDPDPTQGWNDRVLVWNERLGRFANL
jgi:hypothetical protein